MIGLRFDDHVSRPIDPRQKIHLGKEYNESAFAIRLRIVAPAIAVRG
jgi:hypothetical protein